MEKPTDEQVKKFWEWCGWRDYYPLGGRNGWSEPITNIYSLHLPPIDLNNLFKYAVPKFTMKYPLITFNTNDEDYSCCSINCCEKNCKNFSGWGTPALALFWAIWEVKNET